MMIKRKIQDPYIERGPPQGLVPPAVLQRQLGLLQLQVDLLKLLDVVGDPKVPRKQEGRQINWNKQVNQGSNVYSLHSSHTPI